MDIKAGSKWRLKNNPNKVATVNYVEVDDESVFGGYITIDCPWTQNVNQGRSMDVFLKQYEPVKESQ